VRPSRRDLCGCRASRQRAAPAGNRNDCSPPPNVALGLDALRSLCELCAAAQLLVIAGQLRESSRGMDVLRASSESVLDAACVPVLSATGTASSPVALGSSGIVFPPSRTSTSSRIVFREAEMIAEDPSLMHLRRAGGQHRSVFAEVRSGSKEPRRRSCLWKTSSCRTPRRKTACFCILDYARRVASRQLAEEKPHEHIQWQTAKMKKSRAKAAGVATFLPRRHRRRHRRRSCEARPPDTCARVVDGPFLPASLAPSTSSSSQRGSAQRSGR
jgi:hypothetical protein